MSNEEIEQDARMAAHMERMNGLALRFGGVADFSRLPDSTQRAIYYIRQLESAA